MFKLMDRVPDQEGVNTMLSDLEEHIYASGIADMVESADVITQVRTLLFFGFLRRTHFQLLLFLCDQDSEKYVERLLTLFRRFSSIVADAFSDDPR